MTKQNQIKRIDQKFVLNDIAACQYISVQETKGMQGGKSIWNKVGHWLGHNAHENYKNGTNPLYANEKG